MVQDNWRRWPDFDDEQIAAVAAVLRSGRVNYWTGEEGRAFEREFAAACGRRYGIALANGTLALELALHVLGIGAGDEVVVTPRSFIASASCGGVCGARAGVRRRRSGQPEHHRRDHRRGAVAAHAGDHRGAPRRLAVRHGRRSWRWPASAASS